MSKSTNAPSHRIFAVTRNGKKKYWQPIGAAWQHADGEGFNLALDYLPLNDAEIVIRKPKPKPDNAPPEAEEAEAAGQAA